MPRSLQAYLWDIDRAAGDILTFTRGKQLADYEQDAMLRAAVERNFEVIGEALSQALRFFPQMAGRVADEQQIVAFRNRLIHGYATVSPVLVWEIVHTKLPKLKGQVTQLLHEAEEPQT